MLEEYWPDSRQIETCIRTEAEELSPFVLQVVHEPMHLIEVNITNGNERSIQVDAEEELLRHLKKHSRPIPILGDAGSGKSHLIRWIDVRLKNDLDTKDWVVKRIPKSSSLRQVLEILLDGMQGAKFDLLRAKIHEVGERRSTEEVADLLLVFMSHRLKELLEACEATMEEIRRSGGRPSDEERNRLELIKKHASSSNLPALITDPNFKERLTKPGKCLFNIAERLINGSSTAKIEITEYAFSERDLDLEGVVIDDLSSHAKSYISRQQLNTSATKRHEVIKLLNEIIGDACKVAFQEFFQFNSGQFQELFKDIRRELVGKTLVILVEDMAAITAIENDLIDSLLLESVRDGEVQPMCAVRSAIAVTTGYAGYQRRRNTIASRSGGIEWHIERESHTEGDIHKRVEDFCGRYLNASHYELKEIKQFIETGEKVLPSWDSKTVDDISRDALASFGYSSQAHSLFPYNRASLKALVDIYCKSTIGDLQFNPRTILSQILIPILRDFRPLFIQGKFPPAEFQGLHLPSKLQSVLALSDHSKIEQSLAAAAFWGYGATDMGDLVHTMPPAIANVMGLSELAGLLGNTSPSIPRVNIPIEPATPVEPSSVPSSGEKRATENRWNSETDEAFKNKFIDQKTAVALRNELFDAIKSDLIFSEKWNGVNINMLSYLEVRNTPLINIPYNNNNPKKCYLSFGNEKEFERSTSSLKYKQFIVAIKTKVENDGVWNDSIYEHYCIFQNFINDWLAEAIPSLIVQLRVEKMMEGLRKSIASACVIHPGFIGANNAAKVNILCSHSQDWGSDYRSKTGYLEWDEYKNRHIDSWEETRSLWFGYVAANNHAFSRDLLGVIDASNTDDKVARSAHRYFKESYSKSVGLIAGCSSQIEFIEAFTSILKVIEKMRSNGQFIQPSDEITSRKFVNKIRKVLAEDSIATSWKATSKLLKMITPFGYENFSKAVSKFQIVDVDPTIEVLKFWSDIYEVNMTNFRATNKSNDSDALIVLEVDIESKIASLKEGLLELKNNDVGGN